MDAMHCLRMPHGPAGGPDRPVLSHSSRRNPLLRRHLSFPKGGARLAATRRWTVCAQAPAPPQPEGEDAYPKGLLGGWHRTRGAAVGAAVVLACALGAACLNGGSRAYCCQNTVAPSQHGTVYPTDKCAKVLLEYMFKKRAAPPKEPPMLLLHVAENLADELAKQDYCCLKAFHREQETMDSLCREWSQLRDDPTKYNLGFLLIEIFIKQGDYKNAQKICEHELEVGSPNDPRPRLFLAIFKMMLALESLSKPLGCSKEMVKEAAETWEGFRKAYVELGGTPQVNSDDH